MSVTWYTRLEQGRPIRASVGAGEAAARTLRLDPVERQHLFRAGRGARNGGPAGGG